MAVDAGPAGRPRRLGGDPARPVAALPGRIQAQHQRLARASDRVGTRQPAEVRRHEQAARRENAAHLGDRSVDVEIHPALTRDDDIEARVGERARLGSGDGEVDGEPFGAGARARRGDLSGRDVDAADDRAAPRQLARDQASAGAEVEDALAGDADAERGEQVVQACGRAGPVRGVVGRGAAPVDRPAAVDGDVRCAHAGSIAPVTTPARAPRGAAAASCGRPAPRPSAPQPQKKSARTAPVIAAAGVLRHHGAAQRHVLDSGSVVSSHAIVPYGMLSGSTAIERPGVSGTPCAPFGPSCGIGQRLLAEEDVARVAPEQLVDALPDCSRPTAGSPATRPASSLSSPCSTSQRPTDRYGWSLCAGVGDPHEPAACRFAPR